MHIPTDLVWIWKMRRLVVKSGIGNSIFLSIRPVLKSRFLEIIKIFFLHTHQAEEVQDPRSQSCDVDEM